MLWVRTSRLRGNHGTKLDFQTRLRLSFSSFSSSSSEPSSITHSAPNDHRNYVSLPERVNNVVLPWLGVKDAGSYLDYLRPHGWRVTQGWIDQRVENSLTDYVYGAPFLDIHYSFRQTSSSVKFARKIVSMARAEHAHGLRMLLYPSRKLSVYTSTPEAQHPTRGFQPGITSRDIRVCLLIEEAVKSLTTDVPRAAFRPILHSTGNLGGYATALHPRSRPLLPHIPKHSRLPLPPDFPSRLINSGTFLWNSLRALYSRGWELKWTPGFWSSERHRMAQLPVTVLSKTIEFLPFRERQIDCFDNLLRMVSEDGFPSQVRFSLLDAGINVTVLNRVHIPNDYGNWMSRRALDSAMLAEDVFDQFDDITSTRSVLQCPQSVNELIDALSPPGNG